MTELRRLPSPAAAMVSMREDGHEENEQVEEGQEEEGKGRKKKSWSRRWAAVPRTQFDIAHVTWGTSG